MFLKYVNAFYFRALLRGMHQTGTIRLWLEPNWQNLQVLEPTVHLLCPPSPIKITFCSPGVLVFYFYCEQSKMYVCSFRFHVVSKILYIRGLL